MYGRCGTSTKRCWVPSSAWPAQGRVHMQAHVQGMCTSTVASSRRTPRGAAAGELTLGFRLR